MKYIVDISSKPSLAEKDELTENNSILCFDTEKNAPLIIGKSSVTVWYNVESTGTCDILCNRTNGVYFSGITDVIKMYVDDSKTSVAPSLTYDFDTTGIHKVKFIFKHGQSGIFERFLDKYDSVNINVKPTKINFREFDTTNISTLMCFLQSCGSLKYITDLKDFNTSNVITFAGLFNNCRELIRIGDISNWDTSNVVNMQAVFQNCYHIQGVGDIGKWDVSNVTDMRNMFMFSYAFKDSDLSNWNTSKVTTMANMFYYSQNVYAKVEPVMGMTKDAYLSLECPIIENISIPPIPKGCDTTNMFRRQHFLKNIISCGKISASLNLYYENYERECVPNLTRESLLVLFNALDAENPCTITLSPWNKEKLTSDDLKIATDKGWTVA